MGQVAARVSRASSVGRIEQINELLVVCCMAFALCSTFSRVGILDSLNKAIIAVFCLLILVLFFHKRQTKFSFFVLSITAILHAVAFLFPISPKEGIATYFMYAFWVLFWLYMSQNWRGFLSAVRNMKSGLDATAILWSVMVFGSLFIPVCYKIGWGGTHYFTSFTTDSFEIAPVAMFMMALNILLYKIDKNKKKAILLSIIPLTCVFAAGTRTYLIVVLIEFAILLRVMIKGNSAYAFVLLLMITVFFGIASVTNIGQKFESATFDTNDIRVFLNVFTNGRSEFWMVDWNAFLQGDRFSKLFGHGFSYVYDLNQATIGMRLYAHNDFINILLNFGLIGMLVYFAVFVPMVGRIGFRCGMVICLLFTFTWLFNAFFNMIYVYAIAVIGMGLLAVALLFDEKSEGFR